ncbi:biotin transporter BioY [Candidatus Woesearchaeota archaeon]|nr:biotin transporter BioY [Candidatus Woesearchaeota archaeon]
MIVSIIVIITFLLIIYYSKKTKSFSLDTILAMFAGTLIIYVLGSIQGKLYTGLSWSVIFVGWVLPFIVGDTIKLILAAWIAKNVDIKKYMK